MIMNDCQSRGGKANVHSRDTCGRECRKPKGGEGLTTLTTLDTLPETKEGRGEGLTTSGLITVFAPNAVIRLFCV